MRAQLAAQAAQLASRDAQLASRDAQLALHIAELAASRRQLELPGARAAKLLRVCREDTKLLQPPRPAQLDDVLQYVAATRINLRVLTLLPCRNGIEMLFMLANTTQLLPRMHNSPLT